MLRPMWRDCRCEIIAMTKMRLDGKKYFLFIIFNCACQSTISNIELLGLLSRSSHLIFSSHNFFDNWMEMCSLFIDTMEISHNFLYWIGNKIHCGENWLKKFAWVRLKYQSNCGNFIESTSRYCLFSIDFLISFKICSIFIETFTLMMKSFFQNLLN